MEYKSIKGKRNYIFDDEEEFNEYLIIAHLYLRKIGAKALKVAGLCLMILGLYSC